MNILVTGSNGQLGNELRRLTSAEGLHTFTFVDVDEMDLRSKKSITTTLEAGKWDVLINCAAYTNVDKAEEEPVLAYEINSESVKNIADLCSRLGIRLIHISTDYVFDGSANVPWSEDAEPNPLNVYGRSKLEGEKHILDKLSNAYIIRTSWLYSVFGRNFVKTISSIARQKASLNVVYDQVGSPTYARDLARVILKITDNIFFQRNDHPGVYHYSNEGVASWYDLAQRIVEHLGLDCRIIPVASNEYKTAAARPKYSVFNKAKIKEKLGVDIPHWSTSLIECLKEMKD